MDPSSRPQQHHQHTADESGGVRESVYASDGLPSLVVPLPPPPLRLVGGRNNDDGGTTTTTACVVIDDVEKDAIIESIASDPRDAFDMFDVVAGVGGLPYSSSSAANIATWEDPRRRLFRLRSEIEDLERSLLASDDGGGVDDLATMASDLKSRLDALSGGGSCGEEGKTLASMLLGRQVDLTSVIARDVGRLVTAAGATNATDAPDVASGGDEGASSSSSPTGGKVVYELYKDVSSSKYPIVSPREVALEERLRRLEVIVGSIDAGGGESTSIMERIEMAERLVREVDSSVIERLAARAKVVRADLEAAARARSKLSSSSSGRGMGSAQQQQQQQQDSKTISELHAAMIELDGISAHLPELATRLAELSILHANAADFDSRLRAAETATSRMESTLTSVEDGLSRMEAGWKENIQIIERNVDRLDGLVNSK